MEISGYDAFEIRITGPEHRLEARSPAGSVSLELGDRLRTALGSIGFRRVARGVAMRDSTSSATRQTRVVGRLSEQGSALFEALFPEPIRQLWEESLLHPSQPDHGLCVRFHFDLQDPHQARLAQVPWEILFPPDQEIFLAHSVRTPVTRYLDVPGRIPDFNLPTRLRILAVVSRPRDLQPLELGMELAGLKDEWEQDNVEVEILESPSGETLGASLRRELRRREYHVLHFMGHGTFDAFSKEGFLFFEDERRRSVRVSGRELAVWLLNRSSLRLVVLNACSTGRFEDLQRPFAGVAQALIRQGIAGVLAMQDPMPDDLANVFSRVLYQRLADGAPVEAALSEARLELHAASPSSEAWSTPVLFQRTPRIVKVPPKTGPTLTRLWTLFGSLHALFVLLMFLRNRSVTLPVLHQTLNGEVAAFFGVFFGLPLFYVALYAATEHGKSTKLPKPARELSALRRFALRLPVTFHARVQGKALHETAYQLFCFLLLVVVPMGLQIHLYSDLMRAQVWMQREKILFSSSFRESFTKYVPPEDAFLNDTYRIGSIDDRPGVEKLINNVSYFPFWEAWLLLLAELVALGMCLRLIGVLVRVGAVRRPS